MTSKYFILVAGPNGAGKSSLSRHLSSTGAVIFDPDKELTKLEERMPDLPNENLYYALNYAFENVVRQVISAEIDLTVESNLRDDEIVETVKKFKQNGYETSVVFIALGSVEESLSRVDQRIKEGGHSVDHFSIVYNFEHSKRTLFAIIDRFDKVLILESLQDDVNPILRLLGKKVVLGKPKTAWGNTLQQELIASLNQQGIQTPTDE